MTTSHTPGPWKIIDGNVNRKFHSFSIRPEKSPFKGVVLPIAKVMRYAGTEFGIANARLIAAAPDLLEALKLAVELIESITPLEGVTVRKARAAISKAEGKT